MAVKLIALDLDGTTLSNDHFTIPPRNRRAISAAIASGIDVVPATGRFLQGLPLSIRRVNGIRYAITSNGACVTDISKDKTLYSSLIPCEKAAEITAMLKKLNVYTEIYMSGQAYINQGIAPAAIRKFPFLQLISVFMKRQQVPDLSQFILRQKAPVEKIEILPDDMQAKGLTKDMLKMSGLPVTTSGMESIEITNSGVNKGEALSRLCSLLNIDASDVMAVGDNINDIEMIRFAGIGVAIGNAEKEVRQAADFVTLPNNRSGVAYAIKRFAL